MTINTLYIILLHSSSSCTQLTKTLLFGTAPSWENVGASWSLHRRRFEPLRTRSTYLLLTCIRRNLESHPFAMWEIIQDFRVEIFDVKQWRKYGNLNLFKKLKNVGKINYKFLRKGKRNFAKIAFKSKNAHFSEQKYLAKK